jgi:hypothetical protein
MQLIFFWKKQYLKDKRASPQHWQKDPQINLCDQTKTIQPRTNHNKQKPPTLASKGGSENIKSLLPSLVFELIPHVYKVQTS